MELITFIQGFMAGIIITMFVIMFIDNNTGNNHE
jgi:hypothetical protein